MAVIKCSKSLILGFASLFILRLTTIAQIEDSATNDKKPFTIIKINSPIKIDGILDESPWQKEPQASKFWQYFPLDTSMAETKTEVWMAYDEKNIYLAAKLYENMEGNYVSQSLKRDYSGDDVDGFTVILDPFQDKTNGFFFSVNPYSVQREGLISNGGAAVSDFDLTWDNKWFSAAYIGRGFWSLELAIPFKTLRFQRGTNTWGINFYRTDSRANERSVWSKVPRQFEMYNLAFCGKMSFESTPAKPGANIVLIPYMAADFSKDYLEGGAVNKSFAVGGDTKVSITPSLNLDLTINPDFSQVEVDVQQTNLDRFELFYPEHRQFFLENADLFSSFGSQNARPFFSRRIGTAIDTATGYNVQNRIIAGARLSGRLNEKWRLGILDIQTENDQKTNVIGSNYATIALQRQVFSRSNISAIFVNKQVASDQLIDPLNPADGNYNRLIGIEYNLASSDGKWTGKTYYHQTFSQGNKPHAYSHLATINFSTLKYNASWTQQIIGDGFDAKVGYIPRIGFNRVNPAIGYNLYRNNKLINRYRFNLSNNTTWNEKWGITDNNFSASVSVDFQNTSTFSFYLLSNYVKLFSPFNPTGKLDKLLQPGENFTQNGFETTFQTDIRKPISAQINIISGIYYNGTLRQLSGNLNYRYKQYATFALSYNINKINLKNGYGDATLFLIGPKLDLTLSTKLFWTTFVQYNSQLNNMNINSRIQWRFRPVSDLYVVYTDNYFPDNLKSKNRALVIKFTYWLNI
jgi:hypothetical protein